MYRAKEVEDALLHVVGWEQDVNPNLRVAESLTESESGLTFQSAHPMCTLAMVNALVPSEWERNIPAWAVGTTFRKGELCKHLTKYWKALQESTGETPVGGDSDLYWKETTLLSEKTEQLTRRGIQNAVQRWVSTKKVNKESRTLLEHRAFFDGAGRFQDTVPNQDKIVGFEIQAVHGLGVTVKIDKVGLQFNSPGQVTVYVFHSGKSEPVYQQTVGYTRSNGTFQWFEPQGWYLPYLNEWGAGGTWYLVYVQRDCIPADGVLMRVALYIPGLLICSAAIALILRSYFPPAAYELFVKETSAKWKKPLKTVKTVYDCVSLVIAVALSLIFFGKLEGVGVGTVVSAFVNGTLIHLFGRLYDRLFTFTDRFPLRRYFEEREDSV